jgi:hypothetical protein
MNFLTKLFGLFRAQPTPPVVEPLYSDAEFLGVVMELARQKTRDEQAARAAAHGVPQGPRNAA